MRAIKLILISIVQLSTVAWADPEEIIPVDDIIPIEELKPVCKPNQNSYQVGNTKEHLRAIREAVNCGDLMAAQDLAFNLAYFLQSEASTTTERGVCYDDRKCTSANSNSQVTKDVCKASGGKSWSRTIPTSGPCEKVN